MCEQTEVCYLEGDVVWVKLGSCWWPGKVRDVDKLPEEVLGSFRKKPIAAVQFFEEDKFEYVKNLDQICRYNCRRKNEFIKKGLDMYRKQHREGSSFMDKFPKDVSMAEQLTGGNPNIIADNEFAPKEKPNYRSIFGGEKKLKSISPPTSKVNGRRPPISPPVVSPRSITHPRILKVLKGEESDDHDVRIRQQPVTPVCGESSLNIPYKCYKCSFTSSRLNVIVMHSKCHSGETIATNGSGKGRGIVRSPSASETPKSRGRVRATPSSTSNESKNRSRSMPLEGFESSKAATFPSHFSKSRLPIDSDRTSTEEVYTKDIQRSSEKKSQKMPIFGKRKGTKIGVDKTIKRKRLNEDFREKLLADWGDEDPEEEEKEIEILKQQLSRSETFSSPYDISTPHVNDNVECEIASGDAKTSKAKQFSCFDFDEKADAILDSELEERAKKFAEARKFPRFTEERLDGLKHEFESKTCNIDLTPKEALVDESMSSKKRESKEKPVNTEDVKQVEEVKDLDSVFKNIMTETMLPSLPQVPDEKVKLNMDKKPGILTIPTDAVVESSKVGKYDHDYVTRQGNEDHPALLDPSVLQVTEYISAMELPGTIDVPSNPNLLSNQDVSNVPDMLALQAIPNVPDVLMTQTVTDVPDVLVIQSTTSENDSTTSDVKTMPLSNITAVSSTQQVSSIQTLQLSNGSYIMTTKVSNIPIAHPTKHTSDMSDTLNTQISGTPNKSTVQSLSMSNEVSKQKLHLPNKLSAQMSSISEEQIIQVNADELTAHLSDLSDEPVAHMPSMSHELVMQMSSMPDEPPVVMSNISDEPASQMPIISDEPALQVTCISDEPVSQMPSISNEPASQMPNMPDGPASHMPSMPDEPASHMSSMPDEPAVGMPSMSDEPVVWMPSMSNEPAVQGIIPSVCDEPTVRVQSVCDEPAVRMLRVSDEQGVQMRGVLDEPAVQMSNTTGELTAQISNAMDESAVQISTATGKPIVHMSSATDEPILQMSNTTYESARKITSFSEEPNVELSSIADERHTQNSNIPDNDTSQILTVESFDMQRSSTPDLPSSVAITSVTKCEVQDMTAMHTAPAIQVTADTDTQLPIADTSGDESQCKTTLLDTPTMASVQTYTAVQYMSDVSTTTTATKTSPQAITSASSLSSISTPPTTATMLDDEMELDINSMPVVMDDAVITEEVPSSVSISQALEPAAKTGSVVKLAKTTASKSIRVHAGSSTGNIKVSEGATLISSKSGGGSKFVLIQPSSSGQQTLYTSGKSLQQCLTVKTMPHGSQQVGKKLVIVKSPQGNVQQEIVTPQQTILTSAGKITVPQRIITSQGTILNPLSGKSIVGRGTKLMPLTHQQMKALTGGKQTFTPKFTMQSTQAKVVLPTMQNIQKVGISQASSLKLIGTTGMTRPKSNTILIQTTQATAISGAFVTKPLTATTTVQVQPKLPINQTVMRHVGPRPKLISSSAMGSSLQHMLVGSPGTSPEVRPRMVVHKIRSPSALKQSGMNVQSAKKTAGVFHRSQLLPKLPQQNIQKLSSTPSLKKIIPVQHKVAANISKPGANITEALPSMQPLQPEVTVAPAIQHSIATPTSQLAPQQLTQVMVSTPGDQATATYVLVTIDESGQLMSDSGARTLYIDPASGDLDNIVLTINNPNSSQDILAAALANTDVFQPEPAVLNSNTTSRLLESAPLSAATLHQATMLLPSLGKVLPPTNTAGVLETSLTLNQPIMTPLEVPSATCSMQPPPPPIAVPSSSFAPLSIPATLQLSESSPISSSTLSQTVTKSVVSFHPSMPLLSEDPADSHAPGSIPPSSIIDNPPNQVEPKLSLASSYGQIPGCTSPVIHDSLPPYAQVPEISSQPIYQTPESTSETSIIDPSEASEQDVSTSHVQIPKESSDIIDSSLNQSTSNKAVPPSYSPAMENTSEAVAIKDIALEVQDSSAIEVTPGQGIHIPYDQVESTSQLSENDSQGVAVQSHSGMTGLHPYPQTPESTSEIVNEATQDKTALEVLDSRFPYCEAPGSTSKLQVLPESKSMYQQVPESSEQVSDSSSHIPHSMPLLSDELSDRVRLKRHGSPSSDDLHLAKRVRHEDSERVKDQAPSLRPLLSPALQDGGSDSDDDPLPVFLPPPPTSNKKEYEKDDIVWMKLSNVYWPSVITNVSKKQRKAKVKVVNSPRKEKAFFKSFRALLDFRNRDRNRHLLEEGKKCDIGVQRAFDKVVQFYCEKYTQKTLSASRYLTFDKDDILYGLETTSSDDIPTSSTSTKKRHDIHHDDSDDAFMMLHESEEEDEYPDLTKEDFLIPNFSDMPTEKDRAERDALACKILDVVHGDPCRSYLHSVFQGTTISQRHDIFISNDNTAAYNLRFLSGVGPVANNDLGCQLISTLEGYLNEIDPIGSIEFKGTRNDYLFYVWMPEAIIFALQTIHNVNKDAATKMYMELSTIPS